MRLPIRAAIVVAGLCASSTALAQQLPDSVRAAGVTVAQWQAVQEEVRRVAAARGASERTLQAVAERVSINLLQNGHIDLDQLLHSIDERAQQVADLQTQLAAMERADDPAVAAMLTQARAAIDAGDLTGGDQMLAQAAQSDLAGIARDQTRLANRQARAAQTIAERGRLAVASADYLGAADLYQQAAQTAPEGNVGARWHYLLSQGEALAARGELFNEPDQIRNAVRIYREACLPLVPRNARAGEWAGTQDKLSNALRILSERGDPQALEQGIVASHLALEVDDRTASPIAWARDEGNLANLLSVAGERGDTQALHDAIEAYRAALQVYTRALDPFEWATLQNDLGDTLRILGERGDSGALRDSILALRDALEVRTRAAHPYDWALTQNNLAIALGAAGMRGFGSHAGIDSLRAAVLMFVDVAHVETRENDPTTWATIQNNLSVAYRALGERRDGPQDGLVALQAGVETARAALAIFSQDRSPDAWARSQLNLGSALLDIGQRADRTALAQAEAAFRAAMNVYSPANDLEGWASAERNLALCLRAQVSQGNATRLPEALAAARAALDGFLRADDQESAGTTRTLLADLERM